MRAKGKWHDRKKWATCRPPCARNFRRKYRALPEPQVCVRCAAPTGSILQSAPPGATALLRDWFGIPRKASRPSRHRPKSASPTRSKTPQPRPPSAEQRPANSGSPDPPEAVRLPSPVRARAKANRQRIKNGVEDARAYPRGFPHGRRPPRRRRNKIPTDRAPTTKRARPGQAKAGSARPEKTALAIRAGRATASAQRSRPKAREASQNASAFSVQSRAEGATENTPRAPGRNRRLWRPSALESRLRQVRYFIGAADPDHAARKVTVPRGDRVAIVLVAQIEDLEPEGRAQRREHPAPALAGWIDVVSEADEVGNAIPEQTPATRLTWR